MTYSFHPDAELEFNDAIDYYEECKDDLGFEASDRLLGDLIKLHLKFYH